MKKKLSMIIIVFILVFAQVNALFAASSINYNDISGNWAEEQLTDLINLGVIEGYSDNTIKPDNLITRAEFSEMLIKAMDIQKDETLKNIYFMDVKPGDWYYSAISTLKIKNIIDGYEDKTFKPGKNITRAEMITMLVRVSRTKLNLNNSIKVYKDVPIGYWAHWDIGVASRAGIIAGNNDILKPNEFVTRAEVAYSIDKMIWNQKNINVTSSDNLINITTNYNSKLVSKYNTLDSNVDDLSNASYGNQQAILKLLSDKLKLYSRLNITFNKIISLSNSQVISTSNNYAKISYNYNLTSKMYAGSSIYNDSKEGTLVYSLKRSNDNWLVYDEQYLDKQDTNNVLGKINLAWDYIGSNATNSFKYGAIDGLDIVSPTWFNVSDSSGNLDSRANLQYVNSTHDNGYKVWALATNKFDPALTHSVLSNSVARKKLINNLIAKVDTYKLDGLNIDFENMYRGDKDLYTQFIKELAVPLKSRGVILSVDVTIKANSSWSECYDRAALAKIVDYVAIMTYDQHWSTSPISGSVAQLTWVENGIKGLLSEIPTEKMLLGLPFYTREWKETPDQAITSEAITMAEAQKRIANSGAKKVWDSQSGQYYAEYQKDGSTYKIWVEDEKSIDLKSQLVNKYKLAGVACWKVGLETDDIWVVLKNNLGKT